jgi:hypothetical protein
MRIGRSKRRSKGQDFRPDRAASSQEGHEPEVLAGEMESENERGDGRNMGAFYGKRA